MRLNNLKGMKSRRAQLRANLTPAEAALWKALQRSQLGGRKFRRQHSVGMYVLDFYCPREKLAVELDGAAHDSEVAQHRDGRRDRYLAELGVRVLRFENREVMRNLEGVLEAIRERFAS
jgi:very-short-patch-repair endonuclease